MLNRLLRHITTTAVYINPAYNYRLHRFVFCIAKRNYQSSTGYSNHIKCVNMQKMPKYIYEGFKFIVHLKNY